MGVRFAPSPTGRFHLGNLRTAWISREWARQLGLPWVVRFEDIDGPRVVPGAMDKQLADMAEVGLVPDETLIQSQHRARHWELFLVAAREGWIYPCFCSRKEIQEALRQSASAPHVEGGWYNGHCRSLRDLPSIAHPTLAWRFRDPDDESGAHDFIVARTEPIQSRAREPSETSFVPAYNWACAIDDLDGGYALLVRAWDLEHVASQQRKLQQRLSPGAQVLPAVFHTALVTRNSGGRLEKRTRGVTLDELVSSGLSPNEILRRFDSSVTSEAFESYSPGRIFGEPRRTLTLSDLGFPDHSE